MPSKKWIPPLTEPASASGLSSFGVVPTQILLDPLVGPRELRIFLCLAVHANSQTGHCSPGQERLAEMCGYFKSGIPDKSLVSSLIKNLVMRGWVINLGQQGYNRSNRYTLAVPNHGQYRAVQCRSSEANKDAKELADDDDSFRADGFASKQDYFDFLQEEGVYIDPSVIAAKRAELTPKPDQQKKEARPTRDDCLEAIKIFNEGFEKDIEPEELAEYGLAYPAHRPA